MDDYPKDLAELEAWIERHQDGPKLAIPPIEELDAIGKIILQHVETWAKRRRLGAVGPAERLLLAWFKKRLPDLEATYSNFRAYLLAAASSPSPPDVMSALMRWLFQNQPTVLRDAFTLPLVLMLKAVEDQENETRPRAMALVKNVRELRRVGEAVRLALRRSTEEGPDAKFWTSLEGRMIDGLRDLFGQEAADNIGGAMKKKLDPEKSGPLQTLLAPLRARWDELLASMALLSDETLEAIEGSFLVTTVVSSSHAPSKRGVQRRVMELARAGLSQKEIADFEGSTPKAIAAHLRRARHKRPRSTKVS